MQYIVLSLGITFIHHISTLNNAKFELKNDGAIRTQTDNNYIGDQMPPRGTPAVNGRWDEVSP